MFQAYPRNFWSARVRPIFASLVVGALLLPVAGNADDENAAIIRDLPHNLREAHLRILTDTIRYAFDQGPAWSDNLTVVAMWRMGLIEIERNCFWGKGKKCLQKNKTDKELLLELVPPAPGAGEVSEREAVIEGTLQLMIDLFGERIAELYVIVEQGREQAEQRQPAPETVYSLIGAAARVINDKNGSGPLKGGDGIGKFILDTSTLPGPKEINLAEAIAEVPVPFHSRDAASATLDPVKVEEVLEYLERPRQRTRVGTLLVPKGRTGGVSIYLAEELNRCGELVRQGNTEEAIELLREIWELSDNPAFREHVAGLLSGFGKTAE